MFYQGNVFVQGAPNYEGIPMYYTGKNIHATDPTQRTANTANLLVGDVLVLDTKSNDKGPGTDLANPTTSFLSNPAWVVTHVPNGSELGGPIWAVPLAACRQGVYARTKANMTHGTTTLILTNDTDGTANLRHLVASTTVNSALTAAGIKAIAGETVDTSTTAAVKFVMPGN